MSQHTPGEWEWNTEDWNIEAGGVSIACVFAIDTPDGLQECAANARLIAAAPDLYACCEAAEYILARLTPRYGRLPEHDYYAGILDTVRVALAKARGGGIEP